MVNKYQSYWQCCVCGAIYKTKNRSNRVIYGCRKCHKHNWKTNNRDLIKIEKQNYTTRAVQKIKKVLDS